MTPRHRQTLLSVVPLALLIALLAGAVSLFGDAATAGPAQLSMILAGVAAAAIGMRRGFSWQTLESEASLSIARAMPIVLIILVIGMLIGVWIESGIIPAMIYFGMVTIDPDVFYLAVLFISALVSISTGSSWTTAGTAGVALVSVAALSGFSTAICAGAVISGAYFGDKLSPLSDTTNLAAGMTTTPLFDHIRNMLWTTIPALLVAAVGFFILSMGNAGDVDLESLRHIADSIAGAFNLSPLLIIPLALTFALAMAKVPAFLALLAGTVTGAIVGVITQPHLVDASAAEIATRLINAATVGYDANTGDAALDSLLTRGGMESMLNTIWLIISAMFFGGMMEKSGCLGDIVDLLLVGAQSGRKLMQRAGLTSLIANIITPDQFLSLAVPAQMYADKFEDSRLESRNLSRVLEDFGTVTSPLVPWNTCGAYMAGTLGVATIAYLPFCFFNLASPIISMAFILANKRIDYMPSAQDMDQLAKEPLQP